MPLIAIRTKNLWKFYTTPITWGDILRFKFKGESTTALQNINLEIEKGTITGILGPNGAGKTSLLKIISSLSFPSKGECEVFGHNVTSNEAFVRRLVGYCFPEERSFFWRLSGRENLRFFATLYGLEKREYEEKISELGEILELKENEGNLFLSYSTGIRQRFSIARALLHSPQILIFDELSKGLDPYFQKKIFKLLREDFQAKKNTTILIVSHNLNEIKEICEKVFLINKGEIVASGRIDEIKKEIEDVFKISY